MLAAAGAMPAEPLEREELRDEVQKTMQNMPESMREVLLLSYFHDFSYKEISAMLDVPLGTVKSRLHAAVGYFGKAWIKKEKSKK